MITENIKLETLFYDRNVLLNALIDVERLTQGKFYTSVYKSHAIQYIYIPEHFSSVYNFRQWIYKTLHPIPIDQWKHFSPNFQ